MTEPCTLSPALKRVFLDLPQGPLLEMLPSLLRQWHFELADSSPASGLRLESPTPHQLTVHAPTGLTTHLSFPLRVEELWRIVEAPFYPFPRAHIRLEVDSPVLIHLRGRAEETTLSSLSDRGMRFYCSQELVREELLEAEVRLGREVLSLKGTIIYAQSRADRWEAGAVFQPISKAERDRIRDFIVRTLLARVRSEVGEDCFQKAGRFFYLPAFA